MPDIPGMPVPAPPLHLTHAAHGPALVITAAGELDVATYRQLRTYALDLLAGRPGAGGDLILDLAEVTFIDSSGLGVIVHLFKRVRGRGGAFRLAGRNTQLQGLLRVTGLRTIVPLSDTVPDALQVLKRDRPPAHPEDQARA